MTLWQDFKNNTDKKIHKWHHFFPIYEKHFSSWQNKSLVFWEIGVQNGGSLQMWQRYFGPLAIIIGLDIDPDCKQHEEFNIKVRIGDQSDCVFLQQVIDEFGIPDIVLDDASHVSEKVIQTLEFLYPKMGKNACYMVEDTMYSYYPDFGGGKENPGSFINKTKTYIDQLYDEFWRENKDGIIYNQTFSINYYPGIVALEKADFRGKKNIEITGNVGEKSSRITKFKQS